MVHLSRFQKRNREAKEELISRYGPNCVCCGESNPIFLQLDHKFGNGALHRRKIKPNDPRSAARIDSRMLLGDMRKRGFPPVIDLGDGVIDELQVLCANCNYAKSQLGSCPHGPSQEQRTFWEDHSLQLNLNV